MVTSEWALEDIKDVRRYVAQVVHRRWPDLSPADVEDATAEGVLIVMLLHDRWDPARCASFADLVSQYLPRRLIDWWRKDMRQRNICRRNGRSGQYTYSGVSSLDALSDGGVELAATVDVRVGD